MCLCGRQHASHNLSLKSVQNHVAVITLSLDHPRCLRHTLCTAWLIRLPNNSCYVCQTLYEEVVLGILHATVKSVRCLRSGDLLVEAWFATQSRSLNKLSNLAGCPVTFITLTGLTGFLTEPSTSAGQSHSLKCRQLHHHLLSSGCSAHADDHQK